MNSAQAQAQASLDALAATHPQAADLARYASLATRLDSSLLRRLRLHLLPGAHASAEADLWFSDLSESRDAEWMVLDPAVAALLRERLAGERLPSGARALDLAHHHTRQVHAAWPESLLMEEELAYLALRDGPLAARQIAQRLRPVLAAIASQPQRAVAVSRWVLRALPNMPTVVQQTDEAVAMGIAAIAHLGASPALLGGDAARALPPGLQWLLPPAALARKTRLACDLQARALVLRSPTTDTPASRCIELPMTRPLLVELRVTGGAPGTATSIRTLPVRLGEPMLLPEGWRQLQLRGLDGVNFRIERLAAQEAGKSAARFEIDLFVSYAHVDNTPLPGDAEGWVTQLVQALEPQLAMRLGRPVRIWRDAKLVAGDNFPLDGDARLRATGLLLCVVSPRYLRSEWCHRELEAFMATAANQGVERVDSRSRVFQVRTAPLPDDEGMLSILRETMGYQFFDLGDGVPQRLEPGAHTRAPERFLRTVGQLAYDMANTLTGLEGDPSHMAPRAPDRAAAVYLAECAADLQEPRRRLTRELALRGFRVLPEQVLPTDGEACRVAIDHGLAKAQLAVHLVGRQRGPGTFGPGGRSLVELQLDLAAGTSQRSGLRRLIWQAPNALSDDPRQQEMLQRLQDDPGWQAGADVILGSLEELKAALLDSLPRQPPAGLAAAAEATLSDSGQATPCDAVQQRPARVYLVCTSQDRDAVASMREWCYAQGLELVLPPVEGDAAALRGAHEGALALCDAVLVYYGAGSRTWLRAVEADLRRLAHDRKGRPAPVRAICVAAPDSADKQALVASRAVGLIDLRGGNQAESLVGFVQALRNERASA